jgi:hypothetical protein
VILAKYIVFEGTHAVIRGNHDVNFFPSQPAAVLGTSLAAALGESGFRNVSLRRSEKLPSYSVINDSLHGDQQEKSITIDTREPKPSRKPLAHPAGVSLRLASWNLVLVQDRNTSGAPGVSGIPGEPGVPGDPGLNPGKSNIGNCTNPSGGSANGSRGASGGTAGRGQDGQNGGPGGPGGNAGNITAFVADGDFTVYFFTANGGPGGFGGDGGAGGAGGDGGRGGDGGDGVACACQVGSGGDAGHGGFANGGGKGGNGGTGGIGGNGGNITVIIDQHDAVFDRLRLWIDANHDRVSQPEELFTLPQLGVFSLNLNYRASHRTDEFGNVFRFRAKVNAKDRNDQSNVGTWAWDVFLTTAE